MAGLQQACCAKGNATVGKPFLFGKRARQYFLKKCGSFTFDMVKEPLYKKTQFGKLTAYDAEQNHTITAVKTGFGNCLTQPEQLLEVNRV